MTEQAQPTCRIAVLTMHTSPLEQPGGGDSGGMNVYIRKVATEMASRGVRSDIFTRRVSPDEPAVTYLCPGVRVFAVTAGPARPLHKDRLRTLTKVFALGVAKVMEQEGDYEAIHGHYWLSGIAGLRLSKRFNIPLVMSFHTLARVKDSSASGDAKEPFFRSLGEDRIIAGAQRIIAATDIEKDELLRYYRADPAKVHVVNPGVDLERFTPGDQQKARAKFNIDPETPTILFVGRLQKLKGPHIALGALARLRKFVPDAQLIITGDESPKGHRGERTRLRLLAKGYGVVSKVRFMDPVPHDELAELYRAADAVIIPSSTESFGLVALEASACGTPPVATDVGGLKRLVADGQTGYLVHPRTTKAFARALSRVIADPKARDRLGENAVVLASRFPWKQTAFGLLEAYASVMACQGVRRALQQELQKG